MTFSSSVAAAGFSPARLVPSSGRGGAAAAAALARNHLPFSAVVSINMAFGWQEKWSSRLLTHTSSSQSPEAACRLQSDRERMEEPPPPPVSPLQREVVPQRKSCKVQIWALCSLMFFFFNENSSVNARCCCGKEMKWSFPWKNIVFCQIMK